ncbi:MAG: VCBS repeat-containing protein, partial [Alphaproteobacteria bacterium]
TLTYSIPDESVFEDISPRLADIDQDGNQEAWVIRADDIDGARLEAYAVENGALVRRYAGPAIGQGFRWLNPVGVADFDGDGAFE